jgi:hypothetical protein
MTRLQELPIDDWNELAAAFDEAGDVIACVSGCDAEVLSVDNPTKRSLFSTPNACA